MSEEGPTSKLDHNFLNLLESNQVFLKCFIICINLLIYIYKAGTHVREHEVLPCAHSLRIKICYN